LYDYIKVYVKSLKIRLLNVLRSVTTADINTTNIKSMMAPYGLGNIPKPIIKRKNGKTIIIVRIEESVK